MRKITCIHPSRGRHVQAYKTWHKWRNDADNKFEYILSLDNDACEDYYTQFFYDDSLIKICLRDNKSAIQAINEAAKISTGDILIVISDDFDCFPGWDTALITEFEGKSDFIVKTQDGLQPTLITLPLMDREYYNRFGYIYQNDYAHMFCDQEMTAVGHMIGKVITSNLKFEHQHPLTGLNKYDDINVKNDLTWPQGEALFNQRLAFNFGILDSEIVKPYSEIVWH